MEQLTTFQTYTSASEVEQVAQILNAQGIPTEIIKKTPQYVTYITGSFNNVDSYVLSIPAADFEQANKILAENTQSDTGSIDPDHPLHDLTDDELKDILAKPDEWGVDNYRIAYTLLESKGMKPTSDELEELKKERKAAIARAKTMNPTLIGVGYIMALTPAILWGLYSIGIHLLFFPGFFGEILWFFGLIISFVMIASKTTLPDGNRVNTYTTINRIHGMIICAIYAITILVIFISEVPVR